MSTMWRIASFVSCICHAVDVEDFGDAAACVSSQATTTCRMTIDNEVTHIRYNGADVSAEGNWNSWSSVKEFTLNLVPGAELEIGGLEHDTSTCGCSCSGLLLECDNGFVSNTVDWVAVGSTYENVSPSAGYGTVCTTTSGFYLPGQTSGAQKIWASNSERYAWFKATPEEEAPTPTPTEAPTPTPTEAPTPTPTDAPTLLVSNERSLDSGACPQWCVERGEAWGTKCTWRNCMVCEDCKDELAKGGCGNWCGKHRAPWTTKCDWDNCWNCTQCKEPGCQLWCGLFAGTWSKKCGFQNCRDCAECNDDVESLSPSVQSLAAPVNLTDAEFCSEYGVVYAAYLVNICNGTTYNATTSGAFCVHLEGDFLSYCSRYQSCEQTGTTCIATGSPTESPTPAPTESPTPAPTESPTPAPTESPTPAPTDVPAGISATIEADGGSYSWQFPSSAVLDPTWHGGSHFNQQTWLTPNHQTSWFTLRLNSVSTVTEFHLLNTCNTPYNDRSTNDYTIQVSTDGIAFSAAASGTLTTCANIHGTPIVIPNTGPMSNIQYVKFIVDSFYRNGGGLNYFQAFGS